MNTGLATPAKLHRALVAYFRTMGFNATADALCSEASVDEKGNSPFNFIELWNDLPRLKLIADAQQKAEEKRALKEKAGKNSTTTSQSTQQKATFPDKVIHQFPSSTIAKIHPDQPILLLYDEAASTLRFYDADTRSLLFATTINGEVLDFVFCDYDIVSLLFQDTVRFFSISRKSVISSAVLKGTNNSSNNGGITTQISSSSSSSSSSGTGSGQIIKCVISGMASNGTSSKSFGGVGEDIDEMELIVACVNGKIYSVDYINYECSLINIQSDFGPVTTPITSIASSYKGLFLRCASTDELLFAQLDEGSLSSPSIRSGATSATAGNNNESSPYFLSSHPQGIIRNQTLTCTWFGMLDGGKLMMSGILSPHTALTSKIALMRALGVKGVPLELTAIDNILGRVVLCTGRDGNVNILLCSETQHTPISFNLGVTWPAGCIFHPCSCSYIISLTENGNLILFDLKGKQICSLDLPRGSYSGISSTHDRLISSSSPITPLISMKPTE